MGVCRSRLTDRAAMLIGSCPAPFCSKEVQIIFSPLCPTGCQCCFGQNRSADRTAGRSGHQHRAAARKADRSRRGRSFCRWSSRAFETAGFTGGSGARCSSATRDNFHNLQTIAGLELALREFGGGHGFTVEFNDNTAREKSLRDEEGFQRAGQGDRSIITVRKPS